jgi:hypothetical protein
MSVSDTAVAAAATPRHSAPSVRDAGAWPARSGRAARAARAARSAGLRMSRVRGAAMLGSMMTYYRAWENRRFVRRLLREKQPEFAAALESAVTNAVNAALYPSGGVPGASAKV